MIAKEFFSRVFRPTASRAMALAVIVAVGTASGMLLRGQQKSVSVEGYVLDSSCVFTKNASKPIGKDCALACAKNGSVLVILADDGTIYWPVSDATPAVGQNPRLMEFAGGRIKAQGLVYERGGSHAMVIEEIQGVPAKK